MRDDLLIPIVFPEYLISVPTPRRNVDFLPWFEFDNFSIPATKNRYSNLGHAGILIVNGSSGLTKYYEYGRYDPQNLGLVQRLPIPDAEVGKDSIVLNSLKPILWKISDKSGQGSRIEAVLLSKIGAFEKALAYIRTREALNHSPSRKPYDVTSNSCIHFVKTVVEKAGFETPWMIDPRPNSYIGEFRDDYVDLNFAPKNRVLEIEGKGAISQ